MNFSSDTAAPAHPAILAAIAQANGGAAPSYGADLWMTLATERLKETFETDLDMWLVSSGTAANALGLSVLCPPTGAILCHQEAHIELDERGAPEFFSGGAKLRLLPGNHGKIDALALQARLAANRFDFVHETPAQVVSISNLTECGVAYTAEETAELASRAHAAGLAVHLDGARFANAAASLKASPADLSWKAGIDVMSFGATKNGAMGCEAILLFGRARGQIEELRVRAKRAGHMPPKMRFLGAQMAAYLAGDLWLDLAGRANRAATGLAGVLTGPAAGRLAHPVDGNEVFVELSNEAAGRLTQAGATFYRWIDGSHRFVCSWTTTDAEIAAAAAVFAGVGARHDA
ncbi:MAG: beta-eliminating lyase-related protein [Alphaproteobacteria bacterium]|nr:beta-eliminating lyase-related protein [Alphaproteobacteria bacterium]